MIYNQFSDTSLPVDETLYLPLDGAGKSQTEKISVSDLLAPADTRREDADTNIITGCGTEIGTGLYVPDDTETGLRSIDFANAGLSSNLFNADKLLSRRITNIESLQTRYITLPLTVSQIQKLKETSILTVPKIDGYFNAIKRVFCKVTFNGHSYKPGDNNYLYLAYSSDGANELVRINYDVIELEETSIVLILPVNGNGKYIYASDDIYLYSAFANELEGDSTITLIVEYETIQDFTTGNTPVYATNCLQSFIDVYLTTDVVDGKVEVQHNLNSTKIMSIVMTTDDGDIKKNWDLGKADGSDVENYITIDTGVLDKDMTVALIVNVC